MTRFSNIILLLFLAILSGNAQEKVTAFGMIIAISESMVAALFLPDITLG